jgi:hypothetical protein
MRENDLPAYYYLMKIIPGNYARHGMRHGAFVPSPA